MHEKSVETLEFPKVLARVAREAGFSVGRERVLELEPAADLTGVAARLAFTSEAVRLLEEQPRAGLGSAHDIRRQVRRASRSGDLTAHDLVLVSMTLRSARFVAAILDELDPERFPRMAALRDALPVHPHLIERLEQIVNDEGEVLDSASPALRRLRAEVRAADQRLQQRVRTMVSEFGSALQEPIVTMRGERYVIPVKADFRGRVRGIVHDQSASGATLYVEPLVIVELNNHLRELQGQEREEVERVLREVSGQIGSEASELLRAVDTLAELDLQLAKARYARLTRSIAPRLNDGGRILLHRARHPLLTGRVVPIDFRLGEDFTMVVVTGPNTGGKTVALKTVGLLSLMAQAGLHVPADDGSELAVFEDVFADIGDEQSIEQSLSTFSSHMTRIIDVLRRIEAIRRPLARARAEDGGADRTAPVLVLFDELGAGTDPSEGSALARSILTYLIDRKVPTIATTHYSELKAFAHEQRGAVNASVAFDTETLAPTYELEIGRPGRSNALAIAQRLGLDPRIVRGARRHLGSEGVQMEGLLQALEMERDAAAEDREELARGRADVERVQADLEAERRRLEDERIRILNEARATARDELETVRSELAEIRLSARRSHLAREDLGELRTRARRVEERVAPVPRPSRRPEPRRDAEEHLEGSLEVGDTVRVLRFDQTADLLDLSEDGEQAEVQMGPMRLRVPASELQRVRGRPVETSTWSLSAPLSAEGPPVSGQLDIRGWRVEDALEELESYLNRVALSGMPWVRIVHGKGTGALRSAVRQHLARHPLVQSAEPAPQREGGDGVTVVRLGPG